jgi:hypothetical protein
MKAMYLTTLSCHNLLYYPHSPFLIHGGLSLKGSTAALQPPFHFHVCKGVIGNLLL